MSLPILIADEGWGIVQRKHKVLVNNQEVIQDIYEVKTQYESKIGLIKLKHPCLIHLELYRKLTDVELKYQHLKKAQSILWPHIIWHDWTERRYRAHCEGYNYITLAAGASASKAQPLSAKIKTPDGWTTMGELKVGSTIADTYGKLQTVTALHPQGLKDIYEVKFSDGSITECTEDHLWKVRSKKDRDKKRDAHVLTTKEIKDSIRKAYAVPTISPTFGRDLKPLPIDPWLLGYFIGNGSLSKKCSATITTPTEALALKIKSIWPDSTIKKYVDRNCYLVLLRGLRTILATIPELAFKKSLDKSIPSVYLHGSIETRTAVLQGLIDSDGTKGRNKQDGTGVAFSNKLLRDQTVELARSLGYFTSSALPKKTHYVKDGKRIKCNDSYSCYINKANRHRVIKSITLKRKDYAQCITVSNPNHLYITDDYLPTHNSHDMAMLGILFWYANPSERNVTIASTTLASLMGRVWGYVTARIRDMRVPLPYKYYRSVPPRILLEEAPSGKNKIDDDTLHGIFAVTAKQGDDDSAIASWIGKHPKEKLFVILDEATDMPMSILNALPNLNSHPDKFQLCAIGNSNSTMDLHGLLSTPQNGWSSVTPEVIEWKTKQINGICQYFSPYHSPAITDPDPLRRAILEKFLVGQKTLTDKEKELGVQSEKFYRWVLGFWKSLDSEDIIASEKFLKDFDPTTKVEWSGHYPVQRVAGLDCAFSTGGDKCLLKIANVGHAYSNRVMIDFAQAAMTFEIKLLAIADKSVELQIATQVVDILTAWGVRLEHLCIDVTGQGRAIGEVIRLMNEKKGYPLGHGFPLKIYSMAQHNTTKDKRKSFPDTISMSTHELWNTIREYIEEASIAGLDPITQEQLTSRLIITNETTKRKQLESKRDYKRRMSAIGKAHSPDEADSAALCVQVVKQRLGILPGTVWAVPTIDASDKYRQKMQAFQGLPAAGTSSIQINADFQGGLNNWLQYQKPF